MASFVSLVRAGALLGSIAFGLSAASAAPLLTPCKVSDEALRLGGKLDRAAAELKAGDAFRILVIGSSSTAGVGASAPGKSYTVKLEDELERRLAGVTFDVMARGVGGETAIGAEGRMMKEIAAAKPDLVIWQIGTNDAARKVDLAAFRETALRGLARIAQAGVDAALLDPQYVPNQDAAYAPYLATLDAIASQTGVPLARRYAAMKAIAMAGGGDMISRDRLHMNDAGHACVGAFLAEALDRKLAPIPAPVAEAHRPT
ncbi:SGNH/GDSL hydrolase family protein [Hansschlegelia sp. KR7-227]|uniref:SGNH/GDSL hydrolase family protein n=1 Tax=Hansschlegelia sp. KR7-227 TaxID=3400914 RepID=UPI003C088529